VTYVLFEAPLATLLKRIRPNRLIPCLIISWGKAYRHCVSVILLQADVALAGAVVIGSGFVKNYGGLIATRLVSENGR
jgi:hypothetical protein